MAAVIRGHTVLLATESNEIARKYLRKIINLKRIRRTFPAAAIDSDRIVDSSQAHTDRIKSTVNFQIGVKRVGTNVAKKTRGLADQRSTPHIYAPILACESHYEWDEGRVVFQGCAKWRMYIIPRLARDDDSPRSHGGSRIDSSRSSRGAGARSIAAGALANSSATGY